jgi:hypothetical protein
VLDYVCLNKGFSRKGFGLMPNPASEKQIAFLTTLTSERVSPVEIVLDNLTSKEASDLITLLLNSPRKTSAVELELGMYKTADGEIYRVQRSRESGNLYAKRLDLIEGFVYEQGAIRKITASDRMTLDEAKLFGVETGMCCVCGAFLTDPVSVARGIGPICEGRV